MTLLIIPAADDVAFGPIINSWVAGVLCHTASVGVQATLVTLSISATISGPWSKEARGARWKCVALVSALLFLSVFVLALDGKNIAETLHLHQKPDYTQQDLDSIIPLWTWGCSLLALGAMQIIGDGILVWRCYTVWAQNRRVVMIPALILLLSLFSGLASVVLHVLDGVNPGAYNTPLLVCEISYMLLSVVTAAAATGLICFRLIRVDRQTRALSSISDRRPYTRVMTILLESALPFTLCGVFAAVARAIEYGTENPDPIVFPISMFSTSLWTVFCGLGPTLIVYRASSTDSQVNTTSQERGSQRTLPPLSFGRRQDESYSTQMGVEARRKGLEAVTGAASVILDILTQLDFGSLETLFLACQVSYMLFSVGTAVLATGLICFRLITTKRETKILPRYAYNSDRKETNNGVYTRAIRVLVESELPFTFCGVLAAILFAVAYAGDDSQSNSSPSASLFSVSLWIIFCGMGPTLMVYRANTSETHAHHTPYNQEDLPTLIQQ
ncbi:hypothetical protein FA15DRAFT_705053 [Coprinopsis marcescibilis]|uniref:Uncharacterized protein n=1 Tax=Coprinopsis marcescibilis TaxID=230819 RepID=A0A5C3KTL2_COPMA|nr:hypothetical protein FA15DRAFT_705053 [Coprinopsis marcescibilis]